MVEIKYPITKEFNSDSIINIKASLEMKCIPPYGRILKIHPTHIKREIKRFNKNSAIYGILERCIKNNIGLFLGFTLVLDKEQKKNLVIIRY